ncbi:MAG: hypothetical protein K2M75_01425 [Clostridia bacterium]|nr:hypothetical protein [Clostridia bacterium]
MSVEKMLKYQEVDMRYIKLENEVKNSEPAKKKNMYRAATQKSFDTLTSMDDATKNNMDTVVKNKSKLEQLDKQIDEIATEIAEENDDKQLEYYSKQLEKLSQSLDDMEKETARGNKDMSDAKFKYGKEWEQAKKSNAYYIKYNEEYNNFVKDRAGEANAIRKQLVAMEAELDRELLDRYKKIRASKRPVFVPFHKPNICGGCGMEVAQDVINKLGEGRKIQECPNCGRIIYNKD